MFTEFFARHKKVMLQFSAGKDSAACLWLLQPWWDQVTVVWMNMGNPYLETLEYMDKIHKLVPHFKMLVGNQKSWIGAHGWPVDIVPVEKDRVGFQDYRLCCGENAWKPMAEYVKAQGFDGVIRGQKKSDVLKGPSISGQTIDGVEYLYPIEDWKDSDVYLFLGDRVPPSYKRGIKTSLDCINCTAYVAENRERLIELEKTHPTVASEVKFVHKALSKTLAGYHSLLKDCHG